MIQAENYEDRPTLKQYIEQSVVELKDGTGQEYSDGQWLTLDFDIGLIGFGGRLLVDDRSTNRVKFSLKVKRS